MRSRLSYVVERIHALVLFSFLMAAGQITPERHCGRRP